MEQLCSLIHIQTKTKLTGLEMDEIVSVQFTDDRSIVAVDAIGHIGIWRPHGQTQIC